MSSPFDDDDLVMAAPLPVKPAKAAVVSGPVFEGDPVVIQPARIKPVETADVTVTESSQAEFEREAEKAQAIAQPVPSVAMTATSVAPQVVRAEPVAAVVREKIQATPVVDETVHAESWSSIDWIRYKTPALVAVVLVLSTAAVVVATRHVWRDKDTAPVAVAAVKKPVAVTAPVAPAAAPAVATAVTPTPPAPVASVPPTPVSATPVPATPVPPTPVPAASAELASPKLPAPNAVAGNTALPPLPPLYAEPKQARASGSRKTVKQTDSGDEHLSARDAAMIRAAQRQIDEANAALERK